MPHKCYNICSNCQAIKEECTCDHQLLNSHLVHVPIKKQLYSVIKSKNVCGCMCVHLRVVHVCVCVYVVCLCLCVLVCVFKMHACICLCKYVHVCVFMCVTCIMYSCMDVCSCVSAHVVVYIYVIMSILSSCIVIRILFFKNKCLKTRKIKITRVKLVLEF